MIEGDQASIGKQLFSRADPRAMDVLVTMLKSRCKYLLNRNFFKLDRVTAQEIFNLEHVSAVVKFYMPFVNLKIPFFTSVALSPKDESEEAGHFS